MPATQIVPKEILQPIPKVAHGFTGRRPAPATVWRWLRKGVRGVKLNAVLLGGQWLCTEQDFRRFLSEQTEAALNTSRGPAADEATDDDLRAAGLL